GRTCPTSTSDPWSSFGHQPVLSHICRCQQKCCTPRLRLILTGTSGDGCQGWEACFGVLGTGRGACGTCRAAREILPGAGGTPRALGAILLEWLQTLL